MTRSSPCTGATTCDGLSLIHIFNLAVDPTGLSLNQSQAVTLTVKTNAHAGYTLAAYDTGLTQASVYTIPAITAGPGTGLGTCLLYTSRCV